MHQDSISPNRHREIANVNELLDKIAYLRDLTGRPVGVKTAIGGWQFINELCEAINRRGLEYAPDFLAIDGGEGGSGAAPQALMDHMALPIAEALPRVVDALIESGLRQRIRVIAAGKLITSARAAWALCVGADFVNTARGFMFSLGCIQALRCHQNSCPTGVTTHDKRLQRGLVVEEKRLRVAQYATGMNREIDMIAHSCGCRQARELRREHVRVVQSAGQSVALNILYPYPEAASKRRKLLRVVLCTRSPIEAFSRRRAASITSLALMPIGAIASACEQIGSSAVQPDRRRGCGARVGALGQQRCNHAGEYVTHAGRGHARIAAGVDQPACVRAGDYAAVAFEYHNGVVALHQRDRRFQSVGLHGCGSAAQESRRFGRVRREHAWCAALG